MYLVLLLFASLYSSTLVHSAKQYDFEKAREYFDNFTITYNKNYETDHDKEYSFQIFKENLKIINDLNIKYDGEGEFGINKFTDLKSQDFLVLHTGHHNQRDDYDKDEDDLCDILHDKDIPDVNAPESLDWRINNIVTPIKDQGDCGSCWAFATAGYLESQYALKYNETISLSEQHIIDIDDISDKCCGGFPSLAFSAIIKNGGLNRDQHYLSYLPKAVERSWWSRDYVESGVKVANCHLYKISSEEKVKQLLYKNGPIVVAIRASSMHYFDGLSILTDKQCGKGEINHAVLLIGYGTENGNPYWILKNSWGTDFGEKGFFKIERSDDQDGNCGMLKAYLTTANIE